MNISIIGAGYVGLVTGVCFAELGHNVSFVDVEQNKLTLIKQGIPPIFEENLEHLLQKNNPRISVTSDLHEGISLSDVIFICVGTPSSQDGSPDYSILTQVCQEIGLALKETESWVCIVIKSTLLPGTTTRLIIPTLETHSGKKAGADFGIAVNPEFLKEGVAIHDFFHPDRIIIGSGDTQSEQILRELYSSFESPLLITDITTAEMIKMVSNAFLATKISFANEIGNLCKKLGVDTEEVFRGVGMDSRINPAFFVSGIGFGGSCFPKDLRALIYCSQYYGIEPGILKSTLKRNDDQPGRMISLLKKHVPDLKNATIGILGLSFKPCSDDIRESRAIPVIQDLLNAGARIIAYDPLAMNKMKELYPDITYVSTAECVLDSDAILITTAHQEFELLDFSGKIVIDGRRVRSAEKTASVYEGVCW